MKTCRPKICGLSRFGDILTVNDIPPDYIGSIFAENSHRIAPGKAAQLRQGLDKKIKAVGIFVNVPMEGIVKLSEDQGNARVIDLIQLHGDKDKAYIRQLKTHTSLSVIKMVRIRNRGQILKAQELPCDYLLLNTHTGDEYGGGGTQFSWNTVPEFTKPYSLVDGIHLGSVRQAVSHGPYYIDVSSTVETGDRRDRRKMGEMTQVLR